MSRLSADDFPWKRSRFGFAVFFHFTLLATCSALRLALYLNFGAEDKFSLGTLAQALLIGFHRDWLVALIVTLPLLVWFWIIPDHAYGKPWHRVVLIGGSFLFWASQTFIHFAEYFFFKEFNSRFNTTTVEFLLHPAEVAGYIGSFLPLKTAILVSCAAAIVWLILALVYFRQMWFQPTTGRSRLLHLVIGVVLSGLVFLTIDPYVTHFDNKRTLNEIAENGSISLVVAARAGSLNYAAHYRTLPRNEAFARARIALKQPHMEFTGGTNSLRRKVAGNATRPPLNVVILLEESLGSEFWGCLGRKGASLTPAMDRLALEEGLLFTNIYACGDSAVNGFAGVFSSLPPLPDVSLVNRDGPANIETLAHVLKRDGYSALFIYGGHGLFDGLRSFALNNGWDRFIERKDFSQPRFATVRGVCDEEVFNRAIEEFRGLAAAGKPFFGTVFTVSNQKPFTYPAGSIPDDPNTTARERAVKYSDRCLGQFFARAKKESFWTNTVFIVVANRGAQTPNQQGSPFRSSEIPLVILGPAAVKEPRLVGTLGSSMDVPTTILGLIGRPHETVFFGRDLLNDPPEGARAMLDHNHHLSLFAHDRMVTLGPDKSVAFHEGNPKRAEMKLSTRPEPEFAELEEDTVSLYQVAHELYWNRMYRIDGNNAAPPAASPAPKPPAP